MLQGVVPLRDLIVSSPETKVAEIMSTEYFTVGPDDDQEQVAEMMSKYDLLALPVVDETGRMLGMVTVDDALDVMEQEAAEDLALATGYTQGTQGAWLSLRRTGSGRSPGRSSRSRSPSPCAGLGGLDPLVAGVDVRRRGVAARRAAPHGGHRLPSHLGADRGPGPAWPDDARTRLGTDALAGLVLGWPSGTRVSLALVDVAMQNAASALVVATPVALAMLLVTVVGRSSVAVVAERCPDAGRRVSQTALTAGLVVLAAVLYLGLAAAPGRSSAALGRA